MQRRLFSRLVSVLLALTLVQLLQLSMNLPAQAATSQLSSGALTQAGLTPNSYTFYGSNHCWMLTATNDWYQHQGNWCGIANIRAIQVYDWLYYNGKAPAGITRRRPYTTGSTRTAARGAMDQEDSFTRILPPTVEPT